MIKYQIKERLSCYLNEINLSVNSLERFCGFSGRYFTKANWNLPEKKIDQIISVLPNLNKDWLLTGNGEMKNGGEDIVLNNFVPIDDIKKQAEFNAETRLEIMNRLLEILKKEGLSSPREFEKMIHTMRGVWDNAVKRGTLRVIQGWVNCVLTQYPNYSYDWAFYGTGSMLRQNNQLPLYDLHNIGEANRLINYYSIPGFKDADNLYRIPCDSIDKTIKRGDIVSCKNIDINKDLSINLSKQYLIIPECDEDVFISRIKETEGKISLINDNDQAIYSLGLGDIVYLGQIVGYIHNL